MRKKVNINKKLFILLNKKIVYKIVYIKVKLKR